MAILRVNVAAFRQLMEHHGWSERDLSERMGLAYSYVNRVLAGKRQPGSKFVAGALVIGMTMDQAFVIDQSTPRPDHPT
ncbi:MAG: helix-turn-helix transcriptional regulator [Firmicutes bacterium]|jgi:transcriptional regulator with XRE-family HTH domain|nr:helix-turn-helix transcriptional regulator [Bacillota bacterium]MCL5063757.1 helix-turn-helix transcriptional regulator [Bacillota bacterium]